MRRSLGARGNDAGNDAKEGAKKGEDRAKLEAKKGPKRAEKGLKRGEKGRFWVVFPTCFFGRYADSRSVKLHLHQIRGSFFCFFLWGRGFGRIFRAGNWRAKVPRVETPTTDEKAQLDGFLLETTQVDTHAMSMRRKREMIGKLGGIKTPGSGVRKDTG